MRYDTEELNDRLASLAGENHRIETSIREVYDGAVIEQLQPLFDTLERDDIGPTRGGSRSVGRLRLNFQPNDANNRLIEVYCGDTLLFKQGPPLPFPQLAQAAKVFASEAEAIADAISELENLELIAAVAEAEAQNAQLRMCARGVLDEFSASSAESVPSDTTADRSWRDAAGRDSKGRRIAIEEPLAIDHERYKPNASDLKRRSIGSFATRTAEIFNDDFNDEVRERLELERVMREHGVVFDDIASEDEFLAPNTTNAIRKPYPGKVGGVKRPKPSVSKRDVDIDVGSGPSFADGSSRFTGGRNYYGSGDAQRETWNDPSECYGSPNDFDF
jgi:hypothetical protein